MARTSQKRVRINQLLREVRSEYRGERKQEHWVAAVARVVQLSRQLQFDLDNLGMTEAWECYAGLDKETALVLREVRDAFQAGETPADLGFLETRLWAILRKHFERQKEAA